MKHKVKITILKREYYKDLADRFLVNPETGKCSIFHEGQEFIVTRENYDRFPYENNFCMGAWDVIKIKAERFHLNRKVYLQKSAIRLNLACFEKGTNTHKHR